jgi:uncharacterized repeat protein (TIGR03803 family)
LTNLFSFGAGFTNRDGLNPSGGLVQGKDGNFYGVTPDGGAAGSGTVYKITTNGAYVTLAAFGGASGTKPGPALAQTADGNFYGTTLYGGVYALGTIFRVTPAGMLTTIASFNGTNGANPSAGLIVGTNGLLYGTAQYGGANDVDFGGDGVVFKATTNGVVSVVYSFANGNDGANPAAAVLQAKDGNFYGTTPYGGADFSGTVFKLTAAGVLTTLHAFTGGADGGVPNAPVIQGRDGNFYGTTAYGGTNDVADGGDGTVYKITGAGVFTRLVSFNNTNGSDPEAALVQGNDGGLYGTTAYGGLYGDGVLFRVTTNGVFTNLLFFNGVNGAQSLAALALGSDGQLYGTTSASGLNGVAGGNGTVFRSDTNGALASLYRFGDAVPTGATPLARLVAGRDGNLYGTSAYGGTNAGNYGTVFQLGTNGGHRVLASFNYTNGAYPRTALALASDGNFYGTTAYGGTNGGSSGGYGTAFRIGTNGSLAALASFALTNGANPSGDMVVGPDGNLYGTTRNGGTNNTSGGGNGAVFKLTTNGVLSVVASFASTNGTHPYGGLVLGPDGNFYGTAAYGGTNNLADGGSGTVFRFTPAGVMTRLVSFTGTNGAHPTAALALGPEGALYGTTYDGGAADLGTVFRVTTNGALTVLHSFANTKDGANPYAGLVLGADGNFYGTAANGGAHGDGEVFQISTNGTFAVVYSFSGAVDVGNPIAGLIETSPSHFYGAAETGGTNDLGALFHLFVDPFPSIVTGPSSLTRFVGGTAVFNVSALGAAPLSYRWQRNGSPLSDAGNVTGSSTSALTFTNLALTDAAPYAVVVSNLSGAITSATALLTVVSPFAPTVSTEDASDVTLTGATLNASANPDGAATTALFRWGATTNYGNLTASTNLGTGGDVVSVSARIAGLAPFTSYHFAAVAANSLGTNSGGDQSFMTFGARSNVAFAVLNSFNGTNGASPQGSLLGVGSATLYGTTYDGGAFDQGTVYKLGTNGALTVLLSFNGTNGSHPAASLVQTPNGVLYGTTRDGGTNDLADGGYGTIFKITTNGAFTSVASFNQTNGVNPAGALVVGPDGELYGTTAAGGTNDLADGGDGTIFRISTNGLLTTLYHFDAANGSAPVAGLALGPGGVLYGTTSAGGPDDAGIVFSITTNGDFAVLYAFTGGEDGAGPAAALALGPDGSFYGTTHQGGDYDYGTIFRITTNGALTTVYSFAGEGDGANPSAALLFASDGNLYGTTSSGGPGGYGTLFLITPGGAFATLVLFDSDTYGANPAADLTQTADGALYGTATAGGTSALGTSYRIRLAAPPVIVADPAGGTNFAGMSVRFVAAATGNAPLAYRWRHANTNLADDGRISGAGSNTLAISNLVAADAGPYVLVVSNNAGMATSGVAVLSILDPFPPAVSTLPASEIVIGGATFNALVNPDGAPTYARWSYGLTTNYDHVTDGTNLPAGVGAVEINQLIAGLASFTTYHFRVEAGNSAGTNVGADLTFTTPGAAAGVSFQTLLSFGGTNGSTPSAGLARGADGALYGTTYDGGDYDLGTVFRFAPDGTFTTLLSFNGTNGANPSAELLSGGDGLLYGTTSRGGVYDTDLGGDGTVFAITTNGVIVRSVSFDGFNGVNPNGGLLTGGDGAIYGSTYAGGAYDVTDGGDGTVFRLASTGIVMVASFGGTNGAHPSGRLALGADGSLYGTTVHGGTNEVANDADGTVFKVATSGALTCLLSFGGVNGANPTGGLVLGPDGALYGTTSAGGANDLATGGDGTVFKITTDGLLTTLYSFSGGIDGLSPQAPLVFANGDFYGSTSAGGVSGQGTLFRITQAGVLTTLVLFDFDTYGAQPAGALLAGADGRLYGVAAAGGANGNGTLFRFSPPAGMPVFTSVAQAGSSLVLAWSASPGTTYSVQYRTNLAQGGWLSLTNVAATDVTASAVDTLDFASRRYYRLLLLP